MIFQERSKKKIEQNILVDTMIEHQNSYMMWVDIYIYKYTYGMKKSRYNSIYNVDMFL